MSLLNPSRTLQGSDFEIPALGRKYLSSLVGEVVPEAAAPSPLTPAVFGAELPTEPHSIIQLDLLPINHQYHKHTTDRVIHIPVLVVSSLTPQMLAQTALRSRVASSQLARRGFHSTRAQFASPFHYPEGPRSNIPFNPHTRFFALRYWGFCGMSTRCYNRGSWS